MKRITEEEFDEIRALFSIRLTEDLSRFLRHFYTVQNIGEGKIKFLFKNALYDVPTLVHNTVPKKLIDKLSSLELKLVYQICNIATNHILKRERLKGNPFVSVPTGPLMEGRNQRFREKGFNDNISILQIDMDNRKKHIESLNTIHKLIEQRDEEYIKKNKKPKNQKDYIKKHFDNSSDFRKSIEEIIEENEE